MLKNNSTYSRQKMSSLRRETSGIMSGVRQANRGPMMAEYDRAASIADDRTPLFQKDLKCDTPLLNDGTLRSSLSNARRASMPFEVTLPPGAPRLRSTDVKVTEKRSFSQPSSSV